ncbi:hypothetical protein [Nocardia sp. NPDC057353]|uniref:hypothetical protein n=1 Tax=Nocardia sp. NPDC057353 TaxID=3346104 RepID=UPI00363A860C
MLWVLLAVLVVAVVGLYLLRERGVGRGDSADVAEVPADDDPALPADVPAAPRGPAPPSEPLSPAHRTLTQLNQALDVHTPRTEAARQALEAAADRRRVAGFLLARADTEQAELVALEGLFYIRAARTAMRMDPGPDLPALPAQAEAGEITEARTLTFLNHRIDISPTPSPTTPHHHPGGRIADRPIPAGWYSEQWWRPALATGTWPPGSDALFTALSSPELPESPRPGAGIGLDHTEQVTPPQPTRTPAAPADPPGRAPAPDATPADADPAATDRSTPRHSSTSKPPDPERHSPPTPTPNPRDLPYDDPQYRASGYGITAAHPAPGNNGAEYTGTRNGHRPRGPRGYEDLGGYEGGAYDPGGLDPPY